MKKIVITFLIFLLVFTSGCNDKIGISHKNIENPPENSIPFLTFSVNQDKGYVEAYLNYWDIEKGKIIMRDEVLYIVTAPPGKTADPKILDWSLPVHLFGPPLSWDGESYIYLSRRFHRPKNIPPYFKLKMFDDPRVPDKFVSGKIVEEYDFFSYSKNLEIQMKHTEDYMKEKYSEFIYRVFDDNGKKLIEKNVKVSLYNDIFHGGVDIGQGCLYEKDTKKVKQLLLYYDSMGMGRFLICTIDLTKGTYEWNEVNGIKGCIPPIDKTEVSIINDKFYIPLCNGDIAVIDPDNYTANVIDLQKVFKSLSFYNSPIALWEDYPLDEYKDFLILNGSAVYGENNNNELPKHYHLWMLFDTKTNKVVQLLEWDSNKPQFIVVRDSNGKELSKVETDKLVKDISNLYNINGESYIKFFFIFDKFIRFPHKNGD